MHMKQNIGVAKAPMSSISPTTPPPVPTKFVVGSTPSTAPSPPKSSPAKTNPFANVSHEKSPKLAALEASGTKNYVLVASPTVGSFRRGRTVKGKKQRPNCKEQMRSHYEQQMYAGQTTDEWKRMVKKPSSCTSNSGVPLKRSADGCTKKRTGVLISSVNIVSKDSSIVVSAGLLRIFGRNIAELPLIATSREHQGKGYFQVLFSCIERLLSSLNVQKLVLPAAGDAESIWTNKLGFSKMSEDQLLFQWQPYL